MTKYSTAQLPVNAPDSSSRTDMENNPGFRSLACVGQPDFAINKNGDVIHAQTHMRLPLIVTSSVNDRYPMYSFPLPDLVTQVNYRPGILVGEAFWDTDVVDGPYADYIARAKEFYLLSTNQKRVLNTPSSCRSSYVATIFGDIWNVNLKEKITPTLSRGAYYVRLGNKSKMLKEWIAEAFLPKPGDDYVVVQQDGDYANCRVNNLKWVTKQEARAYTALKTAKQTGGIRYLSQFSISPDIAKIIRRAYGEDILQACLAQEVDGVDYVAVESSDQYRTGYHK